ncbi:MAG TPA: hypothetical protein VFV57_11610 [Limnobacter sp.]|nr:hypothetical protein [Limnobacter sp.]
MSDLLLQLDATALAPAASGVAAALDPSPEVLQAAQQVLLDAGMPEADVQAMPWPELSAAAFAAVLATVETQGKADETLPPQQAAVVEFNSQPNTLDVLASRIALPTEVLRSPTPAPSSTPEGQTVAPAEPKPVLDLGLDQGTPEPQASELAQAVVTETQVDFAGLKAAQIADSQKPTLATLELAPAAPAITPATVRPVDEPQMLQGIQTKPVVTRAEQPVPVQQLVTAPVQVNTLPGKTPVAMPVQNPVPVMPTASSSEVVPSAPPALPTEPSIEPPFEPTKVVANVAAKLVPPAAGAEVVKVAPTMGTALVPTVVLPPARPFPKIVSAPVPGVQSASDVEQPALENTPTVRLPLVPQPALLVSKTPLDVSPGQRAIDWLQDSQFFSDRLRTSTSISPSTTTSAATLNAQARVVSAEQSSPTITSQPQPALPVVNLPVATPVQMSQPLSISTRAEGLQAVVNEALKTIEMRLPGRVELSMLLKDGQKLELVVHAQQQKMDIEISGSAAQMMSDVWSDGSDTLTKTLDTLGYQLQSLRVNGETVQAASAQTGAGLDMAQQQRGGGREQEPMQGSPREREREEDPSRANVPGTEGNLPAPLASEGAVSLYA